VLNDGQQRVGIVWIQKEFGQLMFRYGHLIQFDSTHKVNKHHWNLFNLVFRESLGCWIAGAHMLLSRETNELIGMGLAAIRELMETFNINNLSPWVPRYFIVDDSAAEQQAIESAFENEAVGIYLCKVHSMRTLTRKVSATPVRKLLLNAMHAKTKFGCDRYIKEAIDASPYGDLKRYVRRSWNLESSKKWAMWARNHSMLLLQTTTTNNVESYHSELKRQGRKFVGKDRNFFGVFKRVEQIYEKMRIRREKALVKSKKVGAIVKMYPHLAKFPSIVQVMIQREFYLARDMFNNGEEVRYDLDIPICGCPFYMKYALPCKHIFFADLLSRNRVIYVNLNEEEEDGEQGEEEEGEQEREREQGEEEDGEQEQGGDNEWDSDEDELQGQAEPTSFLTDAAWENFYDGWEECGFEVYFTRERQAATSTIDTEQKEPETINNMPYKENIAILQETYYKMLDNFTGLDNATRKRIVNQFNQNLYGFIQEAQGFVDTQLFEVSLQIEETRRMIMSQNPVSINPFPHYVVVPEETSSPGNF
jgi:hypothetical protein